MEAQALVQARTKVLVSEAQREALEHARTNLKRSNDLGVIRPYANELRAACTCRSELRRNVHIEELRRQAAEDVAVGRHHRSEAAEALSHGNGGDKFLTQAQRLLGQLELLDEQMATELRVKVRHLRS